MPEGSETRLTRWAAQCERRPTIYFLVLAVLLGLLSSTHEADPDLFARLAVGELVTANNGPVLADPFAFTPKKPIWIDHEWLSGYIFFHIYRLTGESGLFFFKLLVASATVALLIKAACRYNERKTGLLLWTVWLLTDIVLVWGTTLRSHSFTFLFLSLLLLGFVNYEKRGSLFPLILAPPIMLFWANAHGGFVVGLGLMGLFLLGCFLQKQRWRIPALLLFASFAATFVNPYGLSYWGYILEAISQPRPGIEEWAPVSLLHTRESVFLITGLLVALGIARVGSRVPCRSAGIFLLAASFFYGISHNRLTPIFSCVALIYGLGFVQALFSVKSKVLTTRFKAFREAGALCAGGLFVVLIAVLTLNWKRAAAVHLDYASYPVDALEWLMEHEQGGNVLVDFNSGSYALWVLHPRFLISVDGRYEEVYPQSTVDLVAQALAPRDAGHEQALLKVDPDFILLPERDREAFQARHNQGEWREIYRDKAFGILKPVKREIAAG